MGEKETYAMDGYATTLFIMDGDKQIPVKCEVPAFEIEAEPPAYKRVYERWQEVNRKLAGEIQTVHNIISDQMRQQTAQPINDTMTSQPVRIKGQSAPIQSKEDLERLAAEWNPWTCFFLGMMFADNDRLKQMREDAAATQEMMEVNARYDRQLIKLSGFEW